MRSIRDLAFRAAQGPNADKQGDAALWIEEAFRELVRQAGGLYWMTEVETALTPATREFDLPSDFMRVPHRGVYLWYNSRGCTASASGTVITVIASTLHGLTAGVQVAVSGTSPATWNAGTLTVAAVGGTGTTFTAACTLTAGTTCNAGTISCTQSGPAYPARYSPRELDIVPEDEMTAGIPARFYHPSPTSIAFDLTSDGKYPAFYLDYEAHAPDTLDLTTSLPGPAFLEKGLIAYAQGMLGIIPFEAGQGIFDQMVKAWLRDQSIKEGRNREA